MSFTEKKQVMEERRSLLIKHVTLNQKKQKKSKIVV